MGQYIIFGQELEVTTEMKNYSYFINLTANAIENATNAFVSRYKSNYPSADNWYSSTHRLAGEQLQAAADQAMSFLTKNKIYTVTANDFFTSDISVSGLNDALEKVDQSIEQVLENANAEKQYRAARKACRTKASGFGFGIDGYIRASVQAGAINATTGLGHSLVNAVGNAGTSIAASSNINSIIKNPTNVNMIAQAIGAIVSQMFMKASILVERNSGIRFDRIPSSGTEQSEAIISNIPNIPEHDRKDALIQAIKLDYLNDRAYRYIVEHYEEDSAQADKMAYELGIDVADSFKQEMNILIDLWYQSLKKRWCFSFQLCMNTAIIIADFETIIQKINEREWDDSMISARLPRFREAKEFFDSICTSYNDQTFVNQEELLNALQELQAFYIEIRKKPLNDEAVISEIQSTYAQYKNLYPSHQILLDQGIDIIKRLQDPSQSLNNIAEVLSKFKLDGNPSKYVLADSKKFSGLIKKIEKTIKFDNNETVYCVFDDGSDQGLFGFLRGFIITSRNIYTYDFPLRNKHYEKYSFDEIMEFSVSSKSNMLCCMNESLEELMRISVEGSSDWDTEVLALNFMLEIVKTAYPFLSNKVSNAEVITTPSNQITKKEEQPASNIAVSETIFCPYCGKKIKRTIKFCNYCGKANSYGRIN